MTPARTAFALLLCLGAPAAAQDSSRPPPDGSIAADQAEPSPRDPIVRPKRGRLIDMIKAIAPPLIEAATSRPPPPRQPVSDPIAPVAPLPPPPATALAPAGTGAGVVPPRPVEIVPKPPTPLPAAVAIPQTPPAARPVPKPPTAPPAAPPVAPPAETHAPLAPTAAPPAADLSPPPAPIVRAEAPPAAVDLETLAPWWSGPTVTWLAILAAIAAVASAHRLRRMRRIARTRAALALSPRLDPVAGASSISGLALVAPPLSIRTRLAPAARG